MTTKKYYHGLLINIGLVIFSVCFAVLIVELGFRVLGFSSKTVLLNRIMMADDYTGFRLKPGSSQPGIPQIMPGAEINSLGMRDREYSETKPDGRYRILAMGDSFAYGRVEEEFNFLTVLEEKLNESTEDKTIEILNSGVPAYQPVNELAYLQHYGLVFEPDVVLFCLYVGNDLFNNHLPPTEINSTMPIEVEDENAKNLPLYSVMRWSELYWTVINIYARWDLASQIQSRMNTIQIDSNSDSRRMIPEFWFMDEEQYKAVLKTQVRIHLKKEFRNEDDHYNVESTIKVTQKMQDLCTQHGMEFVVALLPSEAQVDDAVQQSLIEVAAPIPANQLDFSEPQKTLSTQYNNLGITTIDLLPRFVEVGKDHRLYLLRDTHWNEDGNELAAEVLYDSIYESVRHMK
jgi:hypothetical protein